jgi:flagellar biosynthesis protein FliQ
MMIELIPALAFLPKLVAVFVILFLLRKTYEAE